MGTPSVAPSAMAAEPNVTFKDIQGNSVQLASFKGKVVLVNFWGTWCAPCREEIPLLIGMQQKYADKGFTLVGVATNDELSDVNPFVHNTQFTVDGQQRTMNYPIMMGTDDISSEFGGLIGMPTSILITRDGKIAKKAYIGILSGRPGGEGCGERARILSRSRRIFIPIFTFAAIGARHFYFCFVGW